MKKIFFSALMCFMALSMNAQYVDLGLPSGTKWKSTNEPGFYTYDQAVSNYGNKLPVEWQFQELIDYCEWTWTGKGYKVVGPNNKFIFFPVLGHRTCDGKSHTEKGKTSFYQTSTPEDAESNYVLWVFWDGTYEERVDTQWKCTASCVRLVLIE